MSDSGGMTPEQAIRVKSETITLPVSGVECVIRRPTAEAYTRASQGAVPAAEILKAARGVYDRIKNAKTDEEREAALDPKNIEIDPASIDPEKMNAAKVRFVTACVESPRITDEYPAPEGWVYWADIDYRDWTAICTKVAALKAEVEFAAGGKIGPLSVPEMVF